MADASATKINLPAPVVTKVSIPGVPGDVNVLLNSGTSAEASLMISREIAGAFEYIYTVCEMEEDLSAYPLPVECYGDFNMNGLTRCVEFAKLFTTVGGCSVPTFKIPTPHNEASYHFLLPKYGFPEWAVSFFEPLSFVDLYDMLDAVLFLRFPSLLTFICMAIGSKINRLPRDVFTDTFRKKYEVSIYQILKDEPWLKDTKNLAYRGTRTKAPEPEKEDTKEGKDAEGDAVAEAAASTTKEASPVLSIEERIMSDSNPGPKADLELLRRFYRVKYINYDVYTLIIKCI
jgi:hypothetical protein